MQESRATLNKYKMRWHELLNEGMGLHGWWITQTGEHIDIDHDNDQHHADVAKASFDIGADSDGWEPKDDDYDADMDQGDVEHEADYDSAEEAIKTALDFGWVRGSGSGHGFTIEWESLSRAARKAVLAWMTAYGPAYRSLMIGKGGVEYKRFDDDVRSAIAYVNAETLSEQMILRAPAASDVDNVERELTVHYNPGRHDLISLLNNSREKTLRGFINDRTGDLYVWDAYIADHGTTDSLLQIAGYHAPFPRIVIEYSNGRAQPFAYVDHGMSEEDWSRVPKDRLARSVGPFEWQWT